jgi:misacylated tRNA(Ala) deacylase
VTELLHLRDAYRREFTATVAALRGNAVQLDVSTFYPQGGGQPGDQGLLTAGSNTYNVLDTRREGGAVWHYLDREPPAIGTPVSGEIDWPRRHRLMRYHSALHVLCGVIYQQFGVLVTGCQMYPDRARMDFALEDLSPARVRLVEEAANKVIASGLPIRIHFLTRDEVMQTPELIRTQANLLPPAIQEVRVVDIVGLDKQADGGTHVQSTAEIGPIRIVKTENKGRVNKRLEIVLEEEGA